jgi:hypothetical protein
MVQVDVFWAYGIGASFATAATYQLQRCPKPAAARAEGGGGFAPEPQSLGSNPYLLATVLFCALLFAPSGAWLLHGFPDWETMQVARDHWSLPAWLVALFAGTNVSQGVLGFWVARRLIEAGRTYLAFLQAGIGYFGMFFILVHGWDGRGYQRFFSADREVFASWPVSPGFGDAVSRAVEWLTAPVALTLYGMGAVMIPVMFTLMGAWLNSGYRIGVAEGRIDRGTNLAVAGAVTLVGIFGVALGAAIAGSVIVHLLGWWLGVPVALALGWVVLLRRGTGLARLLFSVLRLPDGDAAVTVGRRTLAGSPV